MQPLSTCDKVLALSSIDGAVDRIVTVGKPRRYPGWAGAALLILLAASSGCDDGKVVGPARPHGNAVVGARVRQGHTKAEMTASEVGALAIGLTTSNLAAHTPTELAQYLAGTGVTVSNVTYKGANRAAGMFGGGTGIIGFEDGIILSTGSIAYVAGANTASDITYDNLKAGDAALTTLAGFETHDAAILTFNFVPNASRVYFQYVFASEEYNEYVNTEFNDVFAFWVNGVNCAVVGDAHDPVTINTINNGFLASTQSARNPNLYINNDPYDGGVPTSSLRATEMDGLTVVLACEADVNAGATNTVRLAIADGGDAILDANVFIRRGSLSTVPPPPNAPTGVTGTVPSGTRINVRWNDASTNETRFVLQRRLYANGSYGPWGSGVTRPQNSIGYNDLGVLANSTYQYRVKACSAAGCSSYSNSARITTAPPPPPNSLAGTAISPTRIDLTWIDASSNENYFGLQRRQKVGSVFGSWAAVQSPTNNATSYSDMTVQQVTEYQYRIRACNGTGCSSWIMSASITTPSASVPPAAPTTPVATAISPTDAFVQWGDASDNETRFTVQRRTYVTGVPGAWGSTKTVAADQTFLLDAGLTANTTYQYRVRACNSFGCSAWVNTSQVTTPA